MIFLGDIAAPDRESTLYLKSIFKKKDQLFRDKNIILNLEGILAERDPAEDVKPILSNHVSLPEVLNEEFNPIISLANNHVLDLPDSFNDTIKILSENNIPYCGAGKSFEDANRPLTFYEGNTEILLFNACWDFLLYSQRNPEKGVYVSELNEKKLLNEIQKYRSNKPDAVILVYLHWSLDMEILPFPMYRQFAKALIDSGVKMVVGTHSHCVQGGEKYKNGYILYGIGNFFIPNKVFVGGKLQFPPLANLELVLEFDLIKDKVLCHWYQSRFRSDQHHLEYIESEEFEESVRLKELSPYQGMTDDRYIKYFKKNRRKKILIPVYKNYKRKRLNETLTSILKIRARFAHFLAKLNFLKWQN